jgi:hypothetical protein
MTVFETLQLSAHFYLPLDTSAEVKDQLVDSVIQELGLEKARATIIGDEKMRGISGGERKRTSIGKFGFSSNLLYIFALHAFALLFSIRFLCFAILPCFGLLGINAAMNSTQQIYRRDHHFQHVSVI